MYGIKRTCIESIHYLLKHFPCVAIVGARQVGKTTLLKQVLPDVPFFDMERRQDFERIKRDPDFFLSQVNTPIIIDESQLLPQLFPALRVAIDEKRNVNGRFLMSGSSSPELLKQINESLAGRIALFELSGFSLEETTDKNSSVFYPAIASKKFNNLLSLKVRFSAVDLLKNCLLGSYPEPCLKYPKNPKAFSLWMENYFQSYIRRDIRNMFPGLNIESYQRFVAMLSGSSGTILNASEFARSLDVSQPTIKSYFAIAHGTFLWRTIPSYQKNIVKRVIKMPKGHVRDTGLLNYMLKINDVEELQGNVLFGRIWEIFIIEQMLKGFKNNLIRLEPFYYRTNNQAEIDLILEGDFGILPVEIKTGTVISEKKIIALNQFVIDHNLPIGIVINNAKEVCWITKKILQIPAGCL